ncbi:MAG: DUF3800 domain-containing protein [Thermoanaerobaculia bacterium]
MKTSVQTGGQRPAAEEVETHVLCVDDSGTKEYSPSGEYGAGNTRYFLFGGPFLKVDEAKKLAARIRRLKLETFGTERIEVKSNWLRIDRERKARYLERFGKSEADLTRFVDAFYQAIAESDLVLIACVVDKVHMLEQYGDRAWYPPAAAYEMLLQRAHAEMADCRSSGSGTCFSTIVDDMSGATPKGHQYRENLRRHHAQLKRSGSTLWKGLTFEHLRSLRFVDSRQSEMLQVADVIAYNVYRQFRQYGEEWETRGLETLPAYPWFSRLLGKFRRGANGRIQGFGVAKIPLRTRVPWRI